MATTIVTKSGSGAPTASDLVAGELAVDLTNKRLYTEDSGGTVLELGTNPASDVTFGDNTKAVFGAGSDLQIYHDGSHSYVSDQGTGNLVLKGNNFRVYNAAEDKLMFAGNNGGISYMYYDGSVRIATSASGIDVTGNSGGGGGSTTPVVVVISDTDTGSSWASGDIFAATDYKSADGSGAGSGVRVRTGISQEGSSGATSSYIVQTAPATAGIMVDRLKISSGGDLSLYEDTGTTPKFYWDASSEYLGIGTDSPTQPLNVLVPDNSGVQIESAAGHKAYLFFGDEASNTVGRVGYDHATDAMGLWTASAEVVVIDSSGIDVTGSVTADGLTVDAGSANQVATFSSTDAGAFLYIQDNNALGYYHGSSGGSYVIRDTDNKTRINIGSGGDISFYEDTGTTPKFFWDASAEFLGIGTTSPASSLDIRSANTAVQSRGNLYVTTTSTAAINEGAQISLGGAYTGASETFFGAIAARKENATVGDFNAYLQFSVRNTGNLSEKMRIDSSGRVGIGTDSPSEELTIRASVPKIQIEDSDGTNQYGQFYHSAGITAILARNDTSDGTIVFQKYDGTTTDETMRIDASGNVLVGQSSTALPGAGNTTEGISVSGQYDAIFVSRGTGSAIVLNRNSDGDIQQFRKDGETVGSISITSSATAFNTSSDQRLKENIADADDAGSKIDAIQVRKFDWKADGSHQDYGMVAQELQTVAPEAVSGDADSEDMMGVDYSKLVPMMLKEIQSLRARIAALES